MEEDGRADLQQRIGNGKDPPGAGVRREHSNRRCRRKAVVATSDCEGWECAGKRPLPQRAESALGRLSAVPVQVFVRAPLRIGFFVRVEQSIREFSVVVSLQLTFTQETRRLCHDRNQGMRARLWRGISAQGRANEGAVQAAGTREARRAAFQLPNAVLRGRGAVPSQPRRAAPIHAVESNHSSPPAVWALGLGRLTARSRGRRG